MKLLTRASLTARNMLFLLSLAWTVSSMAQNAFTDGLAWVSNGTVTSDESPVYSSAYCQDIHYTISTSSNLGFRYTPASANGSGVLFPGTAGQGNTFQITITFNVPVDNFGMRVVDLDEDNQQNGGLAEEYLYDILPAPSSVETINGVNPLFLSGSVVTPDDGNSSNANGNAAGWVRWSGQITSVTFTYQRYNSQYEFVLDSLHFECPCPPPADPLSNAVICPQTQHVLDAATPNATYLWNNGSTSSSITASAPGVYWVNVYRESCLETDTAVVSLVPSPVFDLGPDATICEGDSLVLTADPLLLPVTWQNGVSAAVLTVSEEGFYTAQTSYNGCVLRDTFGLTVNEYPQVSLGDDTTLCEGAELLLKVPHGHSYLWSNGNAGPSIWASEEGTYWVQAANGSCAVSDTIVLHFNPLPPNPLPPDTIICGGDPVTMTLTPVPGASYEWFNGSGEWSVVVSAAGSYWVQTGLNGCLRTDTLRVAEYPSVAESFAYDSVVVICEGKSEAIGPAVSSELVSVTWDDGSGVPAITVDEPGVRFFTVSTPCESATHAIRIEEEKCYCNVWLPNAFTPDANGLNERFGATCDCALDRFELVVFDRWGAIVFSTSDPVAAWNGAHKGAPVPAGVYVYKVIYFSAQMDAYEEQTGHVSVLR